MRVTHGKTHDLWMLDQFIPQSGAFYVIDRGYCDFARLYRLHTMGAFFITRAKRTMNFGVGKRLAVPRGGTISSDWLIRLRGPMSRKLYPDTMRRVRYTDPDTGKRFTFITNNLILDPLTIALLYRKRWQIELFFKWVKQHLHVKAFFGTSPNAVQTQLWIAVLVYVLVAEFKHRHQLPQPLNDILQILSVTIMQKTPINELFSSQGMRKSTTHDRNQLLLLDL